MKRFDFAFGTKSSRMETLLLFFWVEVRRRVVLSYSESDELSELSIERNSSSSWKNLLSRTVDSPEGFRRTAFGKTILRPSLSWVAVRFESYVALFNDHLCMFFSIPLSVLDLLSFFVLLSKIILSIDLEISVDVIFGVDATRPTEDYASCIVDFGSMREFRMKTLIRRMIPGWRIISYCSWMFLTI